MNNVRIISLLTLLFSFTLFTLNAQSKKREIFGFHFSSVNKKVSSVGFQFLSNLIIVPVTINDSETLNFVLDTGVNTILITDPTIAKTLGLSQDRKLKIDGVGGGEAQTASVSIGNTVKLGEAFATNQSIVVLDNDFLGVSEMLGIKIHGIIGYEIFRSFVVSIHFVSNTISLQTPESFEYKKIDINKYPLEIIDAKPYISNVSIWSDNRTVPLKLMIDTGAGHAMSLELNAKDHILLPTKTIRSGLGKGLNGIINGYLGRIPKLMIGNVELNNVVTSFPDSASIKGKAAKQIDRNGIVGCEILRRFNVIFNYPEKYVVLKPYPTKINEPFEHNMSGLEIYASGKALKEYYIESVVQNSPADLAGFKAGDQIIAVDNVRMTDESLSSIYKNFQQAEGRFFELEVIRNGKSYKNSFRLKRAI